MLLFPIGILSKTTLVPAECTHHHKSAVIAIVVMQVTAIIIENLKYMPLSLIERNCLKTEESIVMSCYSICAHYFGLLKDLAISHPSVM